MKTNEKATLGHLLGAADALHEPFTLTGAAWQADWQNRDDYRDGGGAMPWHNPGGNAAERKAYQRARDRLAGLGLVLVTNNVREFERVEGLRVVNWVERDN